MVQTIGKQNEMAAILFLDHWKTGWGRNQNAPYSGNLNHRTIQFNDFWYSGDLKSDQSKSGNI